MYRTPRYPSTRSPFSIGARETQFSVCINAKCPLSHRTHPYKVTLENVVIVPDTHLFRQPIMQSHSRAKNGVARAGASVTQFVDSHNDRKFRFAF